MVQWKSQVNKYHLIVDANFQSINLGLPFDESLYKSEKKVEDGEILTLLKQSTNPRANKKKKKAAEKAVSDETKADDAPMLVESWLN